MKDVYQILISGRYFCNSIMNFPIMKQIFLLLCLTMGFALNIQAVDLQFNEKQVGNKKIIVCKNSSNKDYEIIFSYSSSGHTVSATSPVKQIVKAYTEREIITFTPIKGVGGSIQMNYTYKEIRKSRAKESVAYHSNPNFNGITVFGKNYCGRCDYFMKELRKSNLRFSELNIDTSQSDEDLMWEKLQSSGFNGKSITTPVVVVDNQIYYNIKDLKGFLARLKLR